MKFNIHLIAAARPNFMKIAPLYHSLCKQEWASIEVIHTGQHYDKNMSEDFFVDLGLPVPDVHLEIGGGSHAEQTGKVMMAYEKILNKSKPDIVVVVGDVNATLACSITTVKIAFDSPTHIGMHRPLVGHLEAGLRSYDTAMPEEINRVITDKISDILWIPSRDAHENLIKEGIEENKISFVGNIMIDSFEMLRDKIENSDFPENIGLKNTEYCACTFHRPSNVDSFEILREICDSLISISRKLEIVFPIHPRTRKKLEECGLLEQLKQESNIILKEPMSYIEFMSIVKKAKLLLTDSGGIQEETTYLGIPCLTVRENTERPITIEVGTNKLISVDKITEEVMAILDSKPMKHMIPEFWDGCTADRVSISIHDLLNSYRIG